MNRRSSPRRRSFRPTGVGSYTATSSHPFNARYFEELGARLAREPQPATPSLSVPPGNVVAARTTSFPPEIG